MTSMWHDFVRTLPAAQRAGMRRRARAEGAMGQTRLFQGNIRRRSARMDAGHRTIYTNGRRG